MLDLYPSLMLITFLIFIGLLVFLNKKMYQPIITFMDQRDATIAKNLKEAQELSSNAEHLHVEANQMLDKAKLDANQLKQEAIEKAKSEAEKIIVSKEAELEKAYIEFTKKLENEKEELKNGILSQVPLIKEALKAKFAKL